MKVNSLFFKTILLIALVCNAAASFASLTIDSVRTTPSTCANNGTITVYAHSTGTMLYTITSGPLTRPQQSPDQFVNLLSGTYQVMVTDNLHDTSRVAAIVTGSYTSPNFTPTFTSPQCAGTATGVISGAAHTGMPPFSWVLTNLTTNQTTTQASDTFSNLTSGNYSIRQIDSCGNYATYSGTLTDPNDSFGILTITNRIFNCDSVNLNIVLFVINSYYSKPYTIKVQTHNGTYQHTITNIVYSGSNPLINENVGGVSYGDSINITITDACGRSIHRANTVSDFNIAENFSSISDSCHVKFIADFFVTGDTAQRNVNTTYMPEPVTVVVKSVTTGAVLDSTVTNDAINHYTPFGYSAAMMAGQTYKVTVTDGCGHTYTSNILWPNAPTPLTTKSIIGVTCMDSTACMQIYWQNTFFSLPAVTLLSGPNHISSTKPFFVYYDSIIYPQTHIANSGTNGYFVQLTNLAAGTYHYRVSDSCGNTITDSFTITRQNLNNDHFKFSYIKGCPGQNTIIFGNDYFSSAILTQSSGTTGMTSPTDTIHSLNAGTYELTLQYIQTTYSIPVNHNTSCQIIRDTITIPPYQSPQISAVSQAKCHGAVQVVMQPDSTTGVPPYKYQILSGPQTTGVQSSNYFSLTLPGSYVVRVTDSCGFAGTYTFTVDTTSFTPASNTGSSCAGNSATLICQYSPYVTYIWHLPSGGTYTGDSLYLSPVTISEYGTYHITKIVSVNGCRDTFFSTYIFSGTGVSSRSASICPGQSYLFGGISRTQAGVYYDTIPANPCDSIVTLTLTIRGAVYDSVAQNICPGQSVTVGTHTYTTTGIFRDTFVTSGCDSIHILNLHMGSYRYGAIASTICPGQSVLFGGISRTTAGSYHDTIATSGCDSIVTLTLTIRGPVYDSVAQSICTGQSVTVGTHTYSTTGIYRDTFVTAGCDSIHILNLQVSGFKHGAVAQTICQGQSILFGGITRSLTGAYYDTIPTSGCDSIVTLTLTVRGPAYDSVSQSICPGQSVTVGPHTYTTAGIYRDTFVTANCDSIHILNLQVNSYTHGATAQTICQGQSVVFGGITRSQAGLYYDTIPTAGCDSIITLTLTVQGPVIDSVYQSICTGQSVTVGTHTYTTTGIYRDTFATANCDSIHILNLQVSGFKHGAVSQTICTGQGYVFGTNTLTQSGTYYDTISTAGCDSIVTLALTVHGPAIDSVLQNICSGQSVTVGSHTYSTTGIYRDTFTTVYCDSIHILNLQVNNYIYGSVSQSICQGQSILFGAVSLSQAGVYYDTIPTVLCDSIITLTLSITAPSYDSVSQSICPGQSVIVGTHTYSATGIYRDTFVTANCDSIHILNLQMGSFGRGSISQNICQGQNFSFGSITLTQAGVYYDTIPTSGCDSIVTLTLTITAPAYDSTSTSICAGQSVTVGTHTYSTPGIYRDTFTTANCDSIHVLNLHVGNFSHGAFSHTMCQGQNFVFGTQVLTQAGVYQDTIATASCDSIVTLTLRLSFPVYDSVAQSICQGQNVTIGSHIYTQAGSYIDTLAGVSGCDSIRTLHLTVLPSITPSVSIIVSRGPVVGGMQIDTFTASYTDCTDPYYSWYINIRPLGIHSPVAVVSYPEGEQDSILCRIDCNNECPAVTHSFSNSFFTGISDQISFIQGVNIYPNPTQGTFNMDINALSITNRDAQVSVIDMVGQTVLIRPLILHSGDNRELISLTGAVSGVYIVQLTVDGRSLYYRLVLNK